MRLPPIHDYAMKCCMDGHLPMSMARSLDWLADRGLIDHRGAPTTAGRTAWADHLEALADAACRNNTLPYLPEAAVTALARLVDGLEPIPGDFDALRSHEGLATLKMDGSWWVSDAGRRAVRLIRADQREKTLTQET